jgi:hypothetical protein
VEVLLTRFLKTFPIFNIAHGSCIHIIFDNVQLSKLQILWDSTIDGSFLFNWNWNIVIQIAQNRVSFGTPLDSLGWPWSWDFHNQIARSYWGFHIKSIGDTLYCFTSHLEISKKSFIFDQYFKAILQIALHPRFEINNFLN